MFLAEILNPMSAHFGSCAPVGRALINQVTFYQQHCEMYQMDCTKWIRSAAEVNRA